MGGKACIPSNVATQPTLAGGERKGASQGYSLALDFPVVHPFPSQSLGLGALFPSPCALMTCSPTPLSKTNEAGASWPCRAQVSAKWYKGERARLPPPRFLSSPPRAELHRGCVDWSARVKRELKTPQASLTFHSHSLRACLTHA